LVMVMPDVAAARGDLSAWTPLGMRGSMTGRGDFTGIAVSDDDVVGGPGDYYRAPLFAGGAWRVLAVQLGGLERLVALYRAQLGARGRRDDPVQRARFGEAVARLETARLWSAHAACIAEDREQDPNEIDALVNLARHEFERAALAIIERVERGIGLAAMLRPNPVERIIRDLTTYLRQPFPDAALDAAARWALDERPLHADIGTHG
jgi:alkylation response protein AidB-like acyl-CoA dehydrogenase